MICPSVQACTAQAEDAAEALQCSSPKFKYISIVLGWLITGLAIMLGAPFWFDVLDKFMSICSTIKPKEKSPDAKPIDGVRKPPAPIKAPVPRTTGAAVTLPEDAAGPKS